MYLLSCWSMLCDAKEPVGLHQCATDGAMWQFWCKDFFLYADMTINTLDAVLGAYKI